MGVKGHFDRRAAGQNLNRVVLLKLNVEIFMTVGGQGNPVPGIWGQEHGLGNLLSLCLFLGRGGLEKGRLPLVHSMAEGQKIH